MFFSDVHVQLISRGLLEPGEQLLGQTVTDYLPWWAFGFINRQYLVLATDRRLILVDHRVKFFPVALYMHGAESIPWSQVQELRVKGFLKKKLRIKGTGQRGPVSLTTKLQNGLFGLLAPMKNNMLGARAVADAFAGASRSSLPQGYSQPPQMGYAPPPPPQLHAAYGHPQTQVSPQMPGPMQGQMQGQMPALNAPGYHSVPPPSAQPHASPFGSAPPPPAPPGYPRTYS
jgi:hypothetical protein